MKPGDLVVLADAHELFFLSSDLVDTSNETMLPDEPYLVVSAACRENSWGGETGYLVLLARGRLFGTAAKYMRSL